MKKATNVQVSVLFFFTLIMAASAFNAFSVENHGDRFSKIPLVVSLEKPDLKLKGKLKQGSLIFGQTDPQNTATLNHKNLKMTADGLFVMGFHRDAGGEHQLAIVSPGGKQTEYQLNISPRSYDIQYIEGIPKKMMQPNSDALQRIRRENAMIGKARATNSDLLGFTEPFIWPATGPITGVYGSQRFYNGEPRRPHFGLDIAAPEGADVVAPASGTITLVHPDMFFSGGTIVLDHGYGVSSSFIHLSEVLVEQGQSVSQGKVIGTVGQSGRATGPHLDWRINWFTTRLDPAFLLGLSEEDGK